MAEAVLPLQDNLAAINKTHEKLMSLSIQHGPRLLTAILVLIVGYYAGHWTGKMLDKLLVRLELDITIRQLLVRIARILVFILFLIMALQNLGVDLLPLIAGLGVAGAGIALAMQGVMSNLAAGLTIIFTRPYRVNQYISIAREEGMVENITLFSTTLSHADLSKVVIPNRKIVGEILHNYGELRQLNLTVGVAYDTDLRAALDTIQAVLLENQRVLRQPEPFVQVSALGASEVTISIQPWVGAADFGPAVSEINHAVLEAFKSRGITIPFPQREVRLLEKAC